MERAQVWSIDVLLAVVIFISVIIIFYTTLNSRENAGLGSLQTDARLIKLELEKNPELGFLTEDEINSTRFDYFRNQVITDYQGVKQKLGVRGDFCIFYEDEQGNLILLTDNRVGVGSPDINISGVPCGSTSP